jgi:hypothetical protein
LEKRGVISPWGWRQSEIDAQNQEARAARAPDEVGVSFGKPEGHHVRYEGVRRVLYVEVPAHPQDPAADSQQKLGEAIREILRRWPRTEAFERQSLHNVRPLGPCVVLVLGPVTLYAKASSSDEALARRYAIDRITYALNGCQLDHPQDVPDLLKSRGITIASKTS